MIYILSFLVILIPVIVVGWFYVYLFDVVYGGHDFGTTKLAIKTVAQILRDYNKDSGNLYDLGSCRGDFLIGLLKFCPKLKAHGIDNSSLRVWLSKSLSKFKFRKSEFIKGDIFEQNYSNADSIYIYLDQSLFPALELKLQKELKSGAIVITNTQSFPNWQPDKTLIVHPNKPKYEKMFIYVKA